MMRALVRVGLVTGAAVAALAVAGPASAHVTITASDTTAGAFTILTLSVPHGCDGSPTTEIAVKVPDGITEVTPTRNAYYDLEVVTAKLDEPIIADDGDEITEGVDQVVYTARTPLPDGQRDSFELALQIPADAAGQTLAFPTIQTCEKGSTAWTEVAADGGTGDDLEHPAPSFVVTAATGSGGADGTPTDDGHDADDADDGDDGDVLGVAALAAGLLGLGVGTVALLRTRRRSTD